MQGKQLADVFRANTEPLLLHALMNAAKNENLYEIQTLRRHPFVDILQPDQWFKVVEAALENGNIQIIKYICKSYIPGEVDKALAAKFIRKKLCEAKIEDAVYLLQHLGLDGLLTPFAEVLANNTIDSKLREDIYRICLTNHTFKRHGRLVVERIIECAVENNNSLILKKLQEQPIKRIWFRPQFMVVLMLQCIFGDGHKSYSATFKALSQMTYSPLALLYRTTAYFCWFLWRISRPFSSLFRR